MAGILDYQRYIDLFYTVKDVQDHFPEQQLTVEYDINDLGYDGWVGTVSWQTLIIDRIVRDADNTPDFSSSQVLGCFPSDSQAAIANGILQFPVDMYTGPILPAAQEYVPVTVVSFTFTRDEDIFSQQFLLIENWLPGREIANPINDPNYEPVNGFPSNLTLTVDRNPVLVDDLVVFTASSDIPIDLSTATNWVRFYQQNPGQQKTLVGTSTFNASNLASITIDTGPYGISNQYFYARYPGFRGYGPTTSNQIELDIIEGYPLDVDLQISPNPTWPITLEISTATAQVAGGYPSTGSQYITNALTYSVQARGTNTGEVQQPYITTSSFTNGVFNTQFTVNENYIPTTLIGLDSYTVQTANQVAQTAQYFADFEKDYDVSLRWNVLRSQLLASGVTTQTLAITTSRNFVIPLKPVVVDALDTDTQTTATNIWSTTPVRLNATVELEQPITTAANKLEFSAAYNPNVELQRFVIPTSPQYTQTTFGNAKILMPPNLKPNELLISHWPRQPAYIPVPGTERVSATSGRFQSDTFTNLGYATMTLPNSSQTFTVTETTPVVGLGADTYLLTIDRPIPKNGYTYQPPSERLQYSYPVAIDGLSFSYELTFQPSQIPPYNYPTWSLPNQNRGTTQLNPPNPPYWPADVTVPQTGQNGRYSLVKQTTTGTITTLADAGDDVIFNANLYQYTQPVVASIGGVRANIVINGVSRGNSTLATVFGNYNYNPYVTSQIFTTDLYGLNRSINGEIVETNRLYYTEIDNNVNIGSIFTLNTATVSGNNSYTVVSKTDRYIVVDPPWYTHQPIGFDSLNNKEIEFENPSDITFFYSNQITAVKYTRGLGVPYFDQHTQFNQVKFRDAMPANRIGSGFKLAGNTKSPISTVFTIVAGPDADGWWTIDPPYDITQHTASTIWQQDNETYNYFLANECGRDLVFNIDSSFATDESTALYVIGSNKVAVSYIPLNLRVGATVNGFGLGYTISAIDPVRNILTFSSNINYVWRLFRAPLTYTNPALTYTPRFIGTATNLQVTGNRYQWRLPTTLEPGTYLVTATVVNTLITGTNVPVQYPGNSISSPAIQVASGFNASLRLTVNTTFDDYDLVTLTCDSSTAILPEHFYLFTNPVDFYLDGSIVGSSGWTRIGATLAQRASIQIPKFTYNDTLFGRWAGSLDYVRQYDDQILYQPDDVGIPLINNPIVNLRVLVDNNFIFFAIDCSVNVVDSLNVSANPFLSSAWYPPSGEVTITYTPGEWYYKTRTFVPGPQVFIAASSNPDFLDKPNPGTLDSNGNTEILVYPGIISGDPNQDTQGQPFSTFVAVKAQYQGDSIRNAGISTTATTTVGDSGEIGNIIRFDSNIAGNGFGGSYQNLLKNQRTSARTYSAPQSFNVPPLPPSYYNSGYLKGYGTVRAILKMYIEPLNATSWDNSIITPFTDFDFDITGVNSGAFNFFKNPKSVRIENSEGTKMLAEIEFGFNIYVIKSPFSTYVNWTIGRLSQDVRINYQLRSNLYVSYT
jgi:hypothetical protein